MRVQILFFLLSFLSCGLFLKLQAQQLIICNSFDSTLSNIFIDSNSVWEIGSPNKGSFDSSYSPPNSIITDLINPYRNNDTSSFYVILKDSMGRSLPEYLGIYPPLEVELHHRFNIDSGFDFGRIELSFDGVIWYDLLSSDNGLSTSIHRFESSGDTIFDSLIISGISNGWVHSKITKHIKGIIDNLQYFPDSLILKFSFMTNKVAAYQGWQIDDLCLTMDLIVGVNEISNENSISIFPNPNNGSFILQNSSNQEGYIRISNLQGQEVFSSKFDSGPIHFISTNLTPGLYIATVHRKNGISTNRILIK